MSHNNESLVLFSASTSRNRRANIEDRGPFLSWYLVGQIALAAFNDNQRSSWIRRMAYETMQRLSSHGSWSRLKWRQWELPWHQIGHLAECSWCNCAILKGLECDNLCTTSNYLTCSSRELFEVSMVRERILEMQWFSNWIGKGFQEFLQESSGL